ncbi:GntP family permease [Helicobacter sp. 11S02629-2]|uniref:GntP family permease n=1 Tax=Helicobacter sp. 11S02629-2 TaxID=1476195 RepID=UPI000BA66369|nr:GntP family permease [Helicobacter sp. 11S02629-2]PAF45658.1 transporter [Helicobacter sp. 11S02629-2]
MISILIGLAIIIILAYLGCSMIWVAPLAAGVVAYGGGLDLLDSYTGAYMEGFAGFVKAWFPIFLLGAIFGKMMELTGMATSIANTISKVIGAKRAILGVLVSTAILTYGGVSLFVVVFAVYPLALSLFRIANISRRLIPGVIALGAFSFTMVAMPGTPQIQNLLPMPYFGTTPMAAPLMGIVASIIMAVGGYLYMIYREKRLKAKGEGFSEPDSHIIIEKIKKTPPNFFLSLLPLVFVVVTINAFKVPIVLSLTIAVVLIMVLTWDRFKEFVHGVNEGAKGSLIAIINTSAEVGFGAIVKSVPAFEHFANSLLAIKANPLIAQAISVNLLSGIVGSSSGGMAIALSTFADKYKELALENNIPLDHLHRVTSLASAGLDVMPHNGAVLTLFAITKMRHKDSYMDVFVCAGGIPIIASIISILLASMGVV